MYIHLNLESNIFFNVFIYSFDFRYGCGKRNPIAPVAQVDRAPDS